MSFSAAASGGENTRARSMSIDAGAMQLEQIGYQPEYSWLANQRKRLRNVMDSLWFESIVIVLVMMAMGDYCVDVGSDGDDDACAKMMVAMMTSMIVKTVAMSMRSAITMTAAALTGTLGRMRRTRRRMQSPSNSR